jgi:hypothetical protein
VKVFISWSGEPSRSIARALDSWLESVVQAVDVWMSDEEISSGQRWNEAITKSLDETDFGIVCVTRANQHAPWLIFEAGALTKSVNEGCVVPLCIDLKSAEVTGPLSGFQGRSLDEDGVRRLVQDLNEAAEKKMPKERLDGIFKNMWPDLEAAIREAMQQAPVAQEPQRSVQDMVAEVVETVRRMDRRMDEDLARAYERALRLDEVSFPIDPQEGRPFVLTTGQPMNLRPGEIYAVNRSRSASKAT